MPQPILIKISGHELDDPLFLTEFANVIKTIKAPIVIVHGGGREISTLQQTMGIEPQYLDGVRITDAASLSVVEMVLCGTVNTRLVRYLVANGVDALGLSGVDRGLIRAEKMANPKQDMGFTGSVISVRGEVLVNLLEQGITPVIAPVCMGTDSTYNVNADHVAGAVATAIGADRSIFLTNVEGVLVNNAVVKTLTPQQTQVLIDNGTIFGGMIPKVQTALHALENGVSQAVITNLKGLSSNSGTIFTRSML
jgi:acetylglutamate kinase